MRSSSVSLEAGLVLFFLFLFLAMFFKGNVFGFIKVWGFGRL